MSLALIGKQSSYEFRWRRWSLLRDCVAAHLEHGAYGSRFPQFASIGDALDAALRLPARELGAEIATMRDELARHPATDLVLGPATAAVLYLGVKLDAPRPLTARELGQIVPPRDGETLADYFGSMLESIAEVCRNPADDGTLEVVDG